MSMVHQIPLGAGLLLHEILAAATPQRCAVAVADAAARAVAAQRRRRQQGQRREGVER